MPVNGTLLHGYKDINLQNIHFFTFGQGKNMLSNIWIVLILLKEATTMVLELSDNSSVTAFFIHIATKLAI